MSMKLEEMFNEVRYSGITTAKDVTTTGAASVGSLTNSGASTLSGAVTQKAAIISGSGATATLTAAQSGSTVLFDRAAGIVYTLPAPAVGLWYNFVVTVTVTTNSYKVITDAGTTLLIGSITGIDTDSSNAVAAYTGNGSTHIAVTQAATGTNATGGIRGSVLTFQCVSTTLWEVSGFVQGGGTVATPFATS